MEQNNLEKAIFQQTRFAKWQCLFTALAAAACVGVFVLICMVMPRVDQLSGQMEAVLTDLEVVSQQLADADLAGMVQDVDKLAETSQKGVEQAMEKLDKLDLDTLNKAIADLADVVEPLARFFNVFN